jgi:hypothetical protein
MLSLYGGMLQAPPVLDRHERLVKAPLTLQLPVRPETKQ